MKRIMSAGQWRKMREIMGVTPSPVTFTRDSSIRVTQLVASHPDGHRLVRPIGEITTSADGREQYFVCC